MPSSSKAGGWNWNRIDSDLVEQVNTAAKRLKVLRGERDAVERERAALLSARSIEHVQRELAHVQKKLEEAGVTALRSARNRSPTSA